MPFSSFAVCGRVLLLAEGEVHRHATLRLPQEQRDRVRGRHAGAGHPEGEGRQWAAAGDRARAGEQAWRGDGKGQR